MGYYDGNTVTALWNYAQHYAMNDNSYDTNFGPSTAGAINLVSGQTNGGINNPRDRRANRRRFRRAHRHQRCRSGGRRVLDHHWRNFQHERQEYRRSSERCGRHVGILRGRLRSHLYQSQRHHWLQRSTTSLITATTKADYIPHHQPFQYYKSTANLTHARPTSAAMIGQAGDAANHQYDINDFYTAVNAGNFPAVSFLKAPGFRMATPAIPIRSTNSSSSFT